MQVARHITQTEASALHFTDFDITQSLKDRLTAAGFIKPTPVQAGAIPPALEGDDILATASTGTGKTLSFLVPMIDRLEQISQPSTKGKKSPILALILLPTRELAMQVLDNYFKVCPTGKNDAVLVCGGLSENPQVEALGRGPRLVVATPGRLEDYLKRKLINLRDVDMLVLDEVDRMLDMGFLPTVRRILRVLPVKRQTLFFSATIPPEIATLSKEMLQNPVRVDLAPAKGPAVGITQTVYSIDQMRKNDLLVELLRDNSIYSAIAFTRTKARANRLAAHLQKHDIPSDRIHGDRSQAQRTRALQDFKRGKFRVLVATDIAARGIDIAELGHVVNFDVPMVPEDYVHRVGRTARASATGDAITFVSADEEKYFAQIEKTLGKRLDRAKTPALPPPAPKAAPSGAVRTANRTRRGYAASNV